MATFVPSSASWQQSNMTPEQRADLDRRRQAVFAARGRIPYSKEKFAELLAKSKATRGQGLSSNEQHFLLDRQNMVNFYGSEAAARGMTEEQYRDFYTRHPDQAPKYYPQESTNMATALQSEFDRIRQYSGGRPLPVTDSNFEKAMSMYDLVIADKTHPLYAALVMGANAYWERKGFASKTGGPDGRGFFDKDRAREYMRRKFGPSRWTEGSSYRPATQPIPGARASATAATAGSATAQAARPDAFATQSANTTVNTQAAQATTTTPPAEQAAAQQSTTYNQTTPADAAAQAAAGTAGATQTANPAVDKDKQKQNQTSQFRSQRSGYSGNRRFQPFAGGR